MIELSDADILARLKTFEDAFVERKSTDDARDALKTAVAFANSTPIGYPAILFYGVTDKGEPEGKASLERLQRKISEKLADAYPPIYYMTKVLEKDGRQFLAVIIPGSLQRPHFGGRAFVRDGSRTIEASKEQFERLISERSSKIRKLLEWCGKEVTVRIPVKSMVITPTVSKMVETTERYMAVLTEINQFYVSAELKDGPSGLHSWPVEAIFIGFDGEDKRLELIVADELSVKRLKY